MKKVLFVHNVNTSWVDRDREIIKSQYKTINFYVSSVWSYFSLRWVLSVFKSDVIYCWFASFNFFPAIVLGKLLGKRILIVSGGFDAAKANAIEYGAFTKSKVNQFFRKKLFSFADKVLCVSKSNLMETVVNAKVDSDNCELISHGFLPFTEPLTPWEERKEQVVMLSRCNHDTYYLKGIDQFLRLAELMPDFSFVLIGEVSNELKGAFKLQNLSNFRFTGFLDFNGDSFNQILNESKILLQMSEYESFGCSVIDGALRGCFPITTANYALFEVTKDIGKIIEGRNLKLFKEGIIETSHQNIEVSEISQSASQMFPYDLREKAILKIIEG